MYLQLPILLFALFVLGLITGGLSNLTSGGAGTFTIFFLTSFLGLTIQSSTGTVLAASTVMVLIGAVSFFRKGQVNTQLAVTVGVSGVAAAFFAALWASTINSALLEEVFGAFTLALAVYTASRIPDDFKQKQASQGVPSGGGPAAAGATGGVPQPSRWMGTDPLALTVQITKGVLIGIATGLFGIGLASLSVILFLLLFKLDMTTVLGTSLFASFMRYLGGTIGYLWTGLINPSYFLILVAGGSLGSLVGAKIILERRLGYRDVYVKLIVVAILLFVGYEFLLSRIL